MRILKFGGKSLSTKEKMQNICKYIKKIYINDKKLIIIVSAMGSTTNELTSLSNMFWGENKNERELDVLLSTGEIVSSSLMAGMLTSIGVPAKSLVGFQLEITTFGAFGNSKISYINKQPILDCFKDETVAVVTGFQGINSKKEITTLGRGGSDTTASAIGAIFENDIEIYSDFDGIYSGDPRDLNYKKIRSINKSYMKLLADSGAKVLDSRAVEIAKKFNFDIISKSSTITNNSGTIISDIESDIIAITKQDNLCKVTIVFSNQSKINFIIKNVYLVLKNYNFYNLTINLNNINFLIKDTDKSKIITNLSKKLKLIKK